MMCGFAPFEGADKKDGAFHVADNRNRAPTRMFVMATMSVLGVIALTSIHHAYGAAIYGTPWRLHIVQVGVPVAVLIAVGFYAGWRWPQSQVGRATAALAIVAILVFPVAMIGLFEGGYNHVLKHLLPVRRE